LLASAGQRSLSISGLLVGNAVGIGAVQKGP